MGLASTLVEFFLIGLGTPLTAVCVLPLYPGFVVFLSNQASAAASPSPGSVDAVDSGEPGTDRTGTSDDRTGTGGGLSPGLLGVLVVAGVVTFMLATGLVFTFVLEESLTGVAGVVSPVVFAGLILISVALLLDLEVFSRIPSVDPPQHRHPAATAFGYGFFFGGIVLPCNPGFIALFFFRATLVREPLQQLLGFLAFALGIGAPLLALALVSESLGQRVTRTLARHETAINRLSGAAMLVVSAYYLVSVFDVFGVGSALGVA